MIALLLSLIGLALAGAEYDAEYHAAREQLAADNFRTVMLMNGYDEASAESPAAAAPAELAAMGYMQGNGGAANQFVGGQQTATGQGASVELPVDDYDALRAERRRLIEAAAERAAPLVVLGASRYDGEIRDGALAMTVTLQVTLGGEGRWKTVPLIGEEVVLVSARAGGQTIPISREAGYHVWMTDRTGEADVVLEILAPPRGPRGSIEYDFLVPQTPVTRFESRFDDAGLEPRVQAAVRSQVVPDGAGARLVADLAPTPRVHLVGFRDLGGDGDREARVYAETLNLLSVDEDALELFSVVRYNILYAGLQTFQILVPPGFSVVSADAEGAFRYELEEVADGTLLEGETSFPIRGPYEISLRLARERSGAGFELAMPRCQGVEREYGWLGVEVTGALQLEERGSEEMLAVDVRQLPAEVIQSAVSPVLRAYRYHDTRAELALSAAALPEEELDAGAIDRLTATSVISAEGRAMHDMQIQLRNDVRHSLAMRLPEGVDVRSTLLDGQPVKPSWGADGELILPLRRGAEPFTLQVVLESERPPMRLFGRRSLELPVVDLPVSSASWTVYLPARNDYSRLEGDVAAQSRYGAARWRQAPSHGGVAPTLAGVAPAAGSAETGAMPVRIQLPESGKALTLDRYWLGRDRPLTASFWHLRSWLRAPIGLLFFAALGAALVRSGRLPTARLRRAPGAVAGWWERVRGEWGALEDRPWPTTRWSGTIARGLALSLLILLFLAASARLAWLLSRPYPG